MLQDYDENYPVNSVVNSNPEKPWFVGKIPPFGPLLTRNAALSNPPSAQGDDYGAGGDQQTACHHRNGQFSPSSSHANTITRGTLSLSSGATRDAGPSCSARK